LIASCAHFTRAVARFGSHTDAQPVPHHRATTIAARHLSLSWWVSPTPFILSFFHQADLQQALGIPKGITPIAYLCVGYVSHFHDKPELESAGWLPRLPMKDLVYFEQWGQRDDQQPLIAHLQRDQAAAQRGRQATPA
jgi:hypothetical protein